MSSPTSARAAAVYDSGNYPAGLEKALEAVEYDKVREEQQSLRDQGVYRGIGIASYIHVSGLRPLGHPRHPRLLHRRLRGLDRQDRPPWQGHPVHGDDPDGSGHRDHACPGGRRSPGDRHRQRAGGLGRHRPDPRIPVSGRRAAVPTWRRWRSSRAIEEIKAKAVRIGAGLLEADPDDVAYADGRISVKGAEEMRSLSLADVAQQAYWAHKLPEGDQPTPRGDLRPTTRPTSRPPAGPMWPWWTWDIDTGKIDWVKYVVVDDAGTIINPLLVEGQIHGASLQRARGARCWRSSCMTRRPDSSCLRP